MNNVTITLFVKPESVMIFMEILKILDGLPIDNNYHFQPKDILYSKAMISNYTWINVPVELLFKYEYCAQTLKKNK